MATVLDAALGADDQRHLHTLVVRLLATTDAAPP